MPNMTIMDKIMALLRYITCLRSHPSCLSTDFDDLFRFIGVITFSQQFHPLVLSPQNRPIDLCILAASEHRSPHFKTIT